MVEFSLDESMSKSYLNGFVEGGLDKKSGALLFRWKPYKDLGKSRVIFKRYGNTGSSWSAIHYYDGEYIYLIQYTQKLNKLYGDAFYDSIPTYDFSIHRDYTVNSPFFTVYNSPAVFVDYKDKKSIELTREEINAIALQLHIYFWELYMCNLGSMELAFTNKKTNILNIEKLGITIYFDLVTCEVLSKSVFRDMSIVFSGGGNITKLEPDNRKFEEYDRELNNYKEIFDLDLPRRSFRCEDLGISYTDEVSLFENFAASLSGENSITTIGVKGNNSDIYTIVAAIDTDGYVSTETDSYCSIKTVKLKELREFFNANKDSSFTLTGVDNYIYIHVLEEGAYRDRLMKLLYTAIDCMGYREYDLDKLLCKFNLIALYDNREKPLIKKYIEANEITKEDCKAGLVFFSSDTIHDIIERGTDEYSEVVYYTIFFLVGMFQKLWSRDIRDIKGIKKNLSSDSIKWEVE